jgi:hypothetical protein
MGRKMANIPHGHRYLWVALVRVATSVAAQSADAASGRQNRPAGMTDRSSPQMAGTLSYRR